MSGSSPPRATAAGAVGTTGLRRFVRPSATGRSNPGPGTIPAPGTEPERCEMCHDALDERHGHVVEIEQRSIVCACRACYLLFISEGAAGGRYRSVPERVRHDPARPLADADWSELQIPVRMAFFFRNSVLGRVVAGYPSPGGMTECELDLAAWDRLAAAYPLLGAMTPDVEAIFVSRGAEGSGAEGSGAEGSEAFLLPIDECYALVGELRMRWQGFDGGAEARASIAAFLNGLRRRAVALAPGER
jgi:uncharacterized protein DUF5947